MSVTIFPPQWIKSSVEFYARLSRRLLTLRWFFLNNIGIPQWQTLFGFRSTFSTNFNNIQAVAIISVAANIHCTFEGADKEETCHQLKSIRRGPKWEPWVRIPASENFVNDHTMAHCKLPIFLSFHVNVFLRYACGFTLVVVLTWACFLSLARSKLRLCSANHRAGYFSNLACDWLSIVWAYSEQETENGPSTPLKLTFKSTSYHISSSLIIIIIIIIIHRPICIWICISYQHYRTLYSCAHHNFRAAFQIGPHNT